MLVGNLDEQQMERLRLARNTKKYGHLETWQELFVFQLSIANPTQTKEIGKFAARKNRGEEVTLPLMNNLFNSTNPY